MGCLLNPIAEALDDLLACFETATGCSMTDERRRDAIMDLDPRAHTSTQALVAGLGDESWRVRKAALDRLPDFCSSPTLVTKLIQGLNHDTNAGLRKLLLRGPVAHWRSFAWPV